MKKTTVVLVNVHVEDHEFAMLLLPDEVDELLNNDSFGG